MKDPYDVLGLQPDAALDEIRAAYRQLAHQFHPDKFVAAPPEARRDAHERMQAINHAFAVLTNPSERQRFERQRRRRERRDAENRRQDGGGVSEDAKRATTGSNEGVSFTTGPQHSKSAAQNGEADGSHRRWRTEPRPDDFYIREFSGWGDAHWVHVHGPAGLAGKMNVTTGEVTIEHEEHRKDVLRLLQHYAFDSWS